MLIDRLFFVRNVFFYYGFLVFCEVSFIFNYVYIHVSMCGYVHVSAGSHGDQRCQIPWCWNYRQL